MSYTGGHLRITGGPSAHTVKVQLNGIDISQHLTGVRIKAQVGDIVQAELDSIGAVEFDGEADIEIHSKYAEALRRIEQLEAKHHIPADASPQLRVVLSRLGWR